VVASWPGARLLCGCVVARWCSSSTAAAGWCEWAGHGQEMQALRGSADSGISVAGRVASGVVTDGEI
jgi:hypothetical protein